MRNRAEWDIQAELNSFPAHGHRSAPAKAHKTPTLDFHPSRELNQFSTIDHGSSLTPLWTLADKGYQGSRWAMVPYKGKNKPEPQKGANRLTRNSAPLANGQTSSSRPGTSSTSSRAVPGKQAA
jgi:hypothetical protein